MNEKVTKKILDIYDKYDGDLGLLDERWAKETDKNSVSPRQSEILQGYISNLRLINNGNYSGDLLEKYKAKASQYEKFIDAEVIAIIRNRLNFNQSSTFK